MLGLESPSTTLKINSNDRVVRPKRVLPFDLLLLRNTVDDTHDPEVKNYIEAKNLYQKGYDMCLAIPQGTDRDTLDRYEDDIRNATEYLVTAWLMDDRATAMTERILALGKQYEKVLLKDIPDDQKEFYFVKYSLLFSSWILLSGHQIRHCLNTLSMAILTYSDLPARVYYIRASCYFDLNEEGFIALGINDLEEVLKQDPGFYTAYFILGSVYISLGNEVDNAIQNFEAYLEHGNPASLDTIQSLYALSILYDHKNQTQLSSDFYHRAVTAEAEFMKFYGTHTGLSSMKRSAIILHEEPATASTLIAKYTAKKQYDRIIQERIDSGEIKLSYAPNPRRCSSCGARHKPLLACSGCKQIWYCSRECQVADYRKVHKDACATMQQ